MLFRPSFLPIWFDSLPILPGSAAGAAALKYTYIQWDIASGNFESKIVQDTYIDIYIHVCMHACMEGSK